MFKYIKNLIAKFRIPKGDYCYKIKKIVPDATYGYRAKTKNCPYYGYERKRTGNLRATCKLINKSDILLDDQCKICGINDD